MKDRRPPYAKTIAYWSLLLDLESRGIAARAMYEFGGRTLVLRTKVPERSLPSYWRGFEVRKYKGRGTNR